MMIVFVILCVIFQTSYAQYDVNTTSGPISGRLSTYVVPDTTTDVVEYLGIPYAEPPTSSNRFRPPVAKQPWNETFNADQYRDACPQDMTKLTLQLLGSITTNENFISGTTMNEDCLFLNIYSPNTFIDLTSERRATMVFFHGGDFISGTGMAYSGTVLASLYDVNVVTVNYRLGALGFVSNGNADLAGNYGFQDQQMALQWIKDNIEAFGGDPNSITIFGSGAGGSSVHLHTITESSSGLFQNAIVQSASYDDALWTQTTARGQYEALLSQLSIDPTSSTAIEQLRALSWEDILAASIDGPWQPVVSELFPTNPREAMQLGTYNKNISILVGSNVLDAYDIVDTSVDVTQTSWYYDAVYDITSHTSEFYNWTADDILERMQMFNAYYGGYQFNIEILPDPLQQRTITRIYTDQIYSTWAHEIATIQSRMCDCDVYKYHFRPSYDPSARPLWAAQAVEGDELPYIFGFIKYLTPQALAEDMNLSDQMMTMWTRFAKSSNLPSNLTSQLNYFAPYSNNASDDSCRTALILDVTRDGSGGVTTTEDKETSRNYDFWQYYYVTMGFSCFESTSNPQNPGSSNDPQSVCGPGVWSDAGVVMTNETAGALLITFIVLTAVFLFAFMFSCHRYHKATKKIKKILSDDDSSVCSNRMTTM